MSKILIVEDDIEINKLISEYLSTQGYEVHVAYNGVSALELLKKDENINLILLDIMLPMQSGDRVLQKIREFSNVPVIIVSAKETVQNKIDLMRLGADDYITKPFDLDEVIVRIEAILRRCYPNKNIAEAKSITYKKMTIETANKRITVSGQVLDVTSKEYYILELLLSNKFKLVSAD